MPNVIEFASFNLKEGVSVPDFLLVSDKFNSEFLIAQKGYLSRKLLTKGERWADLVVWETMDDAQNALKAADEDAVAVKYVSLLDDKGMDFSHYFVNKSY